MIVAANNGVLPGALDLMVDGEGIERLSAQLAALKANPSVGHLHLSIDRTSPHGDDPVYREIIITWIGD